jgi:AcrR family transcriptional regulator
MSEPLTSDGLGEHPSVQTKERILDTAERLFAEYGLQKVSTRDITQAANANICAINYYFGGKEELVFEVFNRRLTPLNRKRFAALDELEKAAGSQTPSLEEILTVLIRPAVEQSMDERAGGVCFAKLVGRSLGETGDAFERLKKAHFVPCFERFDAALLRVLPALGREELFWRVLFMFGAMHLMLLTMNQRLPDWVEVRPSLDVQVKRLVCFAAAGLRAARLS